MILTGHRSFTCRLGGLLNLIGALALLLSWRAAPARAQSASIPPRWQAQYTKIYSDDIETVMRIPGQGVVMDAPGSFTSSSSEVIAGQWSIKGSNSGTGTNTTFMHSTVPLAPNHTYRVTFPHRIITTPNKGF